MSAENPAIWGKPDQMQKLNKDKAFTEKAIKEFESFQQGIEDAKVLMEMATEAHDEDTFVEAKNEVIRLVGVCQQLEVQRLLNG